MRIAISQPTYLPWLGYFDLLDQVDAFVLLENVQFEKQSWQQRNRIKTPTGLQWLTVPVVFRGRLGQRINEVEVREADFGRRHCRAIELNYSRAAFFEEYFRRLSDLLNASASQRLVDLNIRILKWLAEVLEIRTPFILASSLGTEGKRTQLLANICRKLGAQEYISPIGSAEYLLGELEIMEAAGVRSYFHNYRHPEYKQLFGTFQPFASVIDLLFNEGARSMEIIRSGRGEVLRPAEVSARLAESNAPAAREA